MGAVSDWRTTGDRARLGGAAVAAATAIVGAQTLDAWGVTQLSQSMYLAPRINWIGAVAGGFIFGVGMVYAGGCPSRSLVRAGGGDVRSFVALLVMTVAAYATLSGVFGAARVSLDQTTAVNLSDSGLATQGLPQLIVAAGVPSHTAAALATVAVAGLLIAFATFAIGPEARLRQLAAGIGVGGLVTLGWALTGLAADDMAAHSVPPSSLSFVKPVADAVDWLERSTALGWPSFGAASVLGVLGGSFAAAIAARSVSFQGFVDAGDLKRHLFGSVAMGIGGVLGLGCTIGQGVTGLSTLAIQSFLAVAAILAGAIYSVTRLQRAFENEKSSVHADH